MEETPDRRRMPATYYYRRELGLRALAPAVGVGVAAGVAAFYLARLFLERTPLTIDSDAAPSRAPTISRRYPTTKLSRS
jgi:hypothetical protein